MSAVPVVVRCARAARAEGARVIRRAGETLRGVSRQAPAIGRVAVFGLGALLLPGPSVSAGGADGPEIPQIVDVAVRPGPSVGTAGEVRLRYRARRANVVAVVQVMEDLDGPLVDRSTLQREVGVVARAFGRESGELTLPLSFRTPGRKRIALTLVTDERERSETVVVYVEVVP